MTPKGEKHVQDHNPEGKRSRVYIITPQEVKEGRKTAGGHSGAYFLQVELDPTSMRGAGGGEAGDPVDESTRGCGERGRTPQAPMGEGSVIVTRHQQ